MDPSTSDAGESATNRLRFFPLKNGKGDDGKGNDVYMSCFSLGGGSGGVGG